ncbi:MAG: hypothetical protein ACLFOY_15455 [Desulfatibacillaceae bacterium]
MSAFSEIHEFLGVRFRMVTDSEEVRGEARRLFRGPGEHRGSWDFEFVLSEEGGPMERETGTPLYMEAPAHCTLFVSDEGEACFDPATKTARGSVSPRYRGEAGSLSLLCRLMERALGLRGRIPVSGLSWHLGRDALLACAASEREKGALSAFLDSIGTRPFKAGTNYVWIFEKGVALSDNDAAETTGQTRARAHPARLAGLLFVDENEIGSGRVRELSEDEAAHRIAGAVQMMDDDPTVVENAGKVVSAMSRLPIRAVSPEGLSRATVAELKQAFRFTAIPPGSEPS